MHWAEKFTATKVQHNQRPAALPCEMQLDNPLTDCRQDLFILKGWGQKRGGGRGGGGSQNQPGGLFLVLTFSEWWQLIRATALVVGDLCSQPVVPCYWRELGEWIKSLSLKPSPLQSTAESGPSMATQPPCHPLPLPQISTRKELRHCNGKHCSSAALRGLCVTYLSLESYEKTLTKERTHSTYLWPYFLSLSWPAVCWCSKERLYSWLATVSVNKFMSRMAWLAGYSQTSKETGNFEGWERRHQERWARGISVASVLNGHENKIKTSYLSSGQRRKVVATFQGAEKSEPFHHEAVAHSKTL